MKADVAIYQTILASNQPLDAIALREKHKLDDVTAAKALRRLRDAGLIRWSEPGKGHAPGLGWLLGAERKRPPAARQNRAERYERVRPTSGPICTAVSNGETCGRRGKHQQPDSTWRCGHHSPERLRQRRARFEKNGVDN